MAHTYNNPPIATVPPEREQSFEGGDCPDCPELGVTQTADPGTDVENELSIPASPLADVSHTVVSLSVQADVDNELERMFVDVGSHNSGGVSCECCP